MGIKHGWYISTVGYMQADNIETSTTLESNHNMLKMIRSRKLLYSLSQCLSTV